MSSCLLHVRRRAGVLGGVVTVAVLALGAGPAVAAPGGNPSPSASPTPATTATTASPTASASTATTAASGASAAGAATGTTTAPTLASATPLPTTQVNGIVWATTTVGTTVYAVGKFTTARPAGAAPGTYEVARANILAFDIRTGVLSTSFVHSLNAQAKTVTASPDGSRLYVGGLFTSVDGQPRARIAAFSTATGALLPYAPQVNYNIETISATDTAVYFGGEFNSVGSAARTRLAATNVDGTLLPWAPSAAGSVRGVIAVPAVGKVYVAGSFSTLNGRHTRGVSAVNTSTGATVQVPVSSQIRASAGNSDSSGVYDLRTDGTRIYGGGYKFRGSAGSGFEGTFAIDPASGTTLWVNDCWGDTYDTAPVAGILYVASHAHNCSAAGWFPDTGHHYYGLAYGETASSHDNTVDARGWDYSAFHTSSLYAWQPTFIQGTIAGQSVWSFTGTSSYLVAAGEFPGVGSVASQGLVRFKIG